MTDKGNCPKHGDFVLQDGCAQCLEEKHKAFTPVPQEEVVDDLSEKEQDYEAGKAEPPTTAIVAVAPAQDTEVLNLHESIKKARDFALAMTVNTLEEAKAATNDLAVIAGLKKSLEAKRHEFIDPHNDYVRQVNEAFKVMSAPVLEADKSLRGKWTTFKIEQEQIRQAAINAAEIQRQADEAARKVLEKTGEKIEGPTEAPVEIPMEVSTRVHTDMGTAGLRDNWKYEVTDINLLPNEYKVPDTAMLNSIAKKYHDSKQIPGVRFYNEPSMSMRTKGGE